MRKFSLISLVVLAGCVSTTEAPVSQQPKPAAAIVPTDAQVSRFKSVVANVEPVAERICRNKNSKLNCDFRIVIDDRPDQEPNAYQTQDKTGRPILAFNRAMIAKARNSDELAFVMGHEAAHHIENHLAIQQTNAIAGMILLGGLAALTGAGSGGVEAAADLGASVGARSYSKSNELEADALGTVIAKRAGYDPVKGAAFFSQIADPGNRFLGTHPPNAQRIETVKRVNDSL